MEEYINLSKSIIEVEDQAQIESLEKKIKKYIKDRNTVFIGKEYYYDTSDNKKQVSRGGGKFIESEINWFLLIDNLSINEYLFEFDWKRDIRTINWGVKKLANKKEL